MFVRFLFISLFIGVMVLSSFGEGNRNLLQKSLEAVKLSDELKKAYTPIPAYEDRAFWDALPQNVRQQAVQAAEKSMEAGISVIPLTAYLEFVRIDDRANCDGMNGRMTGHLKNLVLGELLEGKGRFMDAIADHAWAICEKSTWVGTAHLANQKRGAGVPDFKDIVIDLNSGETSTLMAWVYYFFQKPLGKISPIIPERIQHEINQRTFRPFLERDNLWWMGFRGSFVNNWNIWCNYNVLMSALLAENDLERKSAIVQKSMRSADRFINFYKEDGGCEEGASYWDHAPGKLMEYLETLKAVTGGKIDLFREPVIREMGMFIAKVHVDSNYFVNFADASATGYSLPTVIYRYGKNCNEPRLMAFGRYMGELSGMVNKPLQGSISMALHNLLMLDEFKAAEAKAPLLKSVWMNGVEVAVAREKEGSNQGLFFAAKGGYNNESHNHNDAGTFVLYKNGKPMLVDAGVGTYTAKTFSSKRYDIWTMQSGYHNLPIVNGKQQAFGSKYKATHADCRDNGRRMQLSFNLEKAYPEAAACRLWKRSYTFDRSTGLTVKDRYEVDTIAGDFILHFMTCAAVKEVRPGVVELQSGDNRLQMLYNPDVLLFSQEVIPQEDRRLQKVWGDQLIRMVLKLKNPKQRGEMTVRFK